MATNRAELQQSLRRAAVRCAIYTRKSTDEGLEQDFNSLDAQRKASEAYVKSQAQEGWQALGERYDDGGFTGANMDRPALQRLLTDIKSGQINCVVVYKVDRLTRSLLDFAKIMEVFDKHGVSFVSVTQQFNTTGSLGRLTLHILLSFAQFEREMIAERTRDKMSAARRKGKWVGGNPVLGYDVSPKGGALLVNEQEAERVRAIFDLYLEYGSLMAVVRELDHRGWSLKSWTTRKGTQAGGGAFSKNRLYNLLTNVIYLGKVNHRGQLYAGEQPQIVDADVWQRVQQKLKANGRLGGYELRNKYGAILKGILMCKSCEAAMIHTYTKKTSNKLYRYYVCITAHQHGWNKCPTRSVSAPAIEEAVVAQIRGISASPAMIEAVVNELQGDVVARRADAEQEKLVAERADLTVLVYGQTKIGKSTFCSQSDGALFLATEPGLNALDVYQVPIQSWDDLLNACAEITEGKHPFRTIIIDTIDNAYKFCTDYIVKKYKIEHESDLGYGKGYALVNNEFQRVLTKLAFLPYGLFLVSHAKEIEVDTRTGKYTRIVPTLPDKARKIVLGMVDQVLFCDLETATAEGGAESIRRVIRTKPSLYYEAGDRTGRLPETIDLDFRKFFDAFNAAVAQLKPQPTGKPAAKCWVEYEDLLDRANTLLVMDTLDSRDVIEQHLEGLVADGRLLCQPFERLVVADPEIHRMERDLADVLRTAGSRSPHVIADMEGLLDAEGPELNAEQREAVKNALTFSISLMTGGAGSGKTYAVSTITTIANLLEKRVVLAAPTGKAAKRLEQVVRHEASTIHRLLGFNGSTYSRDALNPIEADILVVDEVSMVDVPLAWRLFQAIDRSKTAVVLVGDHNQLPPVGPGKQQAGGVFDALLQKSQSVWSAIGNSLKTAILTAIKEVVTSRIAATLMYMFTGQKVTFAGGGAGPGGSGGVLRGLGGLLGVGAVPVFGGTAPGGGVVPGVTPGTTPPFVPGGGGLTSKAGAANLFNWQNIKNLASWKNFYSAMTLGGGLMMLSGVQRGSALSTIGGGALMGAGIGLSGGPIGAVGGAGIGLFADAMRRGWGVAEGAAGGAMFGWNVGGPLGALIGAGVGAIAGIVRLFVKGAVEKARQKIKDLYGVDISDKAVLQQIVDMAKQSCGGNLDMAIRTQQVRDLIQLYAMSTGQQTKGMPATIHPLDVVQSGGSLYQSPGYNDGTALPGLGGLPTLDSVGGGVASGAQPVVIQLDGPATTSLLQGQAVQAIASNPRVVQSAVMSASKSNSGRRELTSLQLSPGLVTS